MTAGIRVLVVSHLFPSEGRPTDGPWLAEQVDALAEQGVDVKVLCCSPFEHDRDETTTSGIRVSYRSTSAGALNGTAPGLAVSALRYGGLVERHLAERRGEFDLVHVHFGFPDAWATVPSAQRNGLPVVTTLHGSDVSAALARGCPFGASMRRRIGRSSAVICVSDELTSRVRGLLGPRTDVRTISNGYNARLFTPSQRERDLGFLFLGALREVKDPTLLLSAYLANPELHSWPLTFAGDGPLRPSLEQTAEEAARGQVTFLGSLPREQVADALGRARVLVVPSKREGWGAVASEALACGTPVIASRVGGLPVIVSDDRAGILVDPGDYTKLSDAMRTVMAREWPPADVAAANGALPWSAKAAEIVALYAKVLGGDTP